MRIDPFSIGVAGVLGLAASCGGEAADTPATRLIARFDAETVEGEQEANAELPPSTEWRFDEPESVEETAEDPEPDPAEEGADEALADDEEDPEEHELFELEEGAEAPLAVHGWHALHGIEDLAVRDGRLVGRMTEMPILHTVRPEGMEEDDQLHAVVLRLRVSSGERIGVGFDGDEKLDLAKMLERSVDSSRLSLNRSLTPGDELQTVTLTARDSSFAPSYSIGDVRHVFLRVFGAEESAEFELESMRLVSRREHLAQIPSGVSWQGCADVFRETLVARAPQTMHFTLDLPRNPWLDLELGTVEEGPVRFRVDLRRGERDAPVARTLLRRTLTTPDRWEPTPLELGEWAGQRVTLSLSLEAPLAGQEEGAGVRAIGFWGAPVVRSRGAAAGAITATATRAALTPGSSALPRGVILIVTDTLRRDHLEAYGYHRATAPELARLAAEGARFEDNISQASWTKLSVSSILTSLYPATHGVVDMSDRMPASVTTLAESFQHAGYATFATSSVAFTGKLTNLHQGLEVLHERASMQERGSKTAREYVDRLLAWLEPRKDSPFYARLHVFDPHSPFEPRNPYNTRWAGADGKERHEELIEKAKEFIDDEGRKRRGLPRRTELEAAGIDPADFTRTELDWYDASIRAMDVEIGRLMERLEELGLADDTLIAVISDHGEEFLEHGDHFHGDTVYGELTNVPLFVRWPGVVPATVVPDTVQSIDLLPTLLELCRLPVPAEAQGQSLLPLLTSDPSRLGWEPRPAFSEARLSEIRVPDPEEDVECYSIVADGWRLIHNTVRPEGKPEFELYDHGNDPLNATDVAAEHPEVVADLAGQLAAWRTDAEARRVVADDTSEMTEEERAQLSALGYTD